MLSDVYSREWFKARERYRPVYHAFAEAIEEVFHPRTLVDIGCGAGYLLEHFIGSIPVLGVDGSLAARDVQSPEVHERTIVWDLTAPPVSILGAFEFAVSIEVAEHLPPSLAGQRATEGKPAADPVVSFLAWFGQAQRVLFTAATPGQRGTQHVNCQPQPYWIERFAALGLRHDELLRDAWQAAARKRTRGCPWVVRNAMFFVRAV